MQCSYIFIQNLLHFTMCIIAIYSFQRLFQQQRWSKSAFDLRNGPLTRCVEFWVAHAPEMTGTFPHDRLQRKPLVNDPGMHHSMHVLWCMSGTLIHVAEKKFSAFPDHAQPAILHIWLETQWLEIPWDSINRTGPLFINSLGTPNWLWGWPGALRRYIST